MVHPQLALGISGPLPSADLADDLPAYAPFLRTGSTNYPLSHPPLYTCLAKVAILSDALLLTR
jgi:hypothetical protein